MTNLESTFTFTDDELLVYILLLREPVTQPLKKY